MSINLLDERRFFHRQLTQTRTLSINAEGVASNADKSQRLSCEVALSIARRLGAAEGDASWTDKVPARTLRRQSLPSSVQPSPHYPCCVQASGRSSTLGARVRGNSLPSLNPIAT